MHVPRQILSQNHQRLLEAVGDALQTRWYARNPKTAAAAVAGKVPFSHLGTVLTDVGRKDIDWSGRHHNHQEWRAQLNRFFVLSPLASEYQTSGDEIFAETARDYIVDWLDAHPANDGWKTAPHDNTLNLAIRTQMWSVSLARLLDSPAFDDVLIDRIIESIEAQYRFLLQNLHKLNNWRIAQANSMLFSGMLLAGYGPAETWRRRAANLLNDAFQRQVMPDGCHIERNPGYHAWMTNVFETVWRLGRARPELGLRIDAGKLAKMHDYALATLAPNGATNGMHDCATPLGKKRAASFNADRRRFRTDAGLPDAMPPESYWFPDAGQALLRDGWDADATYVTFDATVWGGGHCHLSRNSVQCMPYGRPLLIDPGVLSYEASDPKSFHGKSTRAHNTINLNGMNQACANPDSRFATVPGYDLVTSRYDAGYWPNRFLWGFHNGHGSGIFGEHQRTLLWVRERAIYIIDRIVHSGVETKPDIESNWQFADVPVHLDPDASRAVTGNDDVNLLLLFAQQPADAVLSIHCGEDNPLRGWLPGNQGAYVAAPQVCLKLTRRETWTTHLVTVLVPFRGPAAPDVKVVDSVPPDNRHNGLIRLQWENGDQDELWWTPGLESSLDQAGKCVTDASLLYLQNSAAGKKVRGLAAEATFAEPYTASALERPGLICFE